MPPGTKSLPEPMLTQIWRHKGIIGWLGRQCLYLGFTATDSVGFNIHIEVQINGSHSAHGSSVAFLGMSNFVLWLQCHWRLFLGSNWRIYSSPPSAAYVVVAACSVPSHYLYQYWISVDWTLVNKFQWNLNRNSIIFIKANSFEKVVC